MFRPIWWIAALVSLAGLATVLDAQFVHLRFESDPEATVFSARGNVPGYPWDTRGMAHGVAVTLDLYYDSTTAPGAAGLYQFNDPAKNYFHISFDPPGILAPINITRPIQSIYVSDSEMDVTFVDLPPHQFAEEFDFLVVFNSPLNGALPVAPVPSLAFDENGFPTSGFSLEGGQNLFRLPNPGGGFLSGLVGEVQGAVHSEFPPVPEPSTYGVSGLVVLLGAIIYRRAHPPVAPRRG